MKTKHLFLGLLATALTFTSCNEDEGVDFQSDSISLSTDNLSVNENDGSFEVFVNLTEAQATDLTVTYSLSGSAVNGVDYTNGANTALISAGNTSVAIPFTLIDNAVEDVLRDVIVTITGVSDTNISVNASDTITISIIDDELPYLGPYAYGLLITNEGPFGSGTGTVTYISDDFSTVNQTIFNTVNSEDLGNIVQSMAFNGDRAYIVANNSDKISIANKNTFVKETAIETGLDNPRYMAFANGKGYVTNWGDGSDATDDFVAVIDLATNTVETTIPVSEGPEHIEEINGKLYVSHKGGYGYGTTISVIDASNTVVSTITVGDVPNDMVVDGANNLWVVCSGKPSWSGSETPGKLVKVNTTTDTVDVSLDFSGAEHPSELALDAGNLYYSNTGAVYTMSETATALPTTSIITTPTYTMAVKDGKLYATDAGNYTDDGTLKVFDLSDNSEIQSITVGLIPGGIYFN